MAFHAGDLVEHAAAFLRRITAALEVRLNRKTNTNPNPLSVIPNALTVDPSLKPSRVLSKCLTMRSVQNLNTNPDYGGEE